MATIERSTTLGVFRSHAVCFSLAFVGLWGVSLPPDVHFATLILLVAGALALMRLAVELHHGKTADRKSVV